MDKIVKIKIIIILVSLLIFYSCIKVNDSLELGRKLSEVKFKYEKSNESVYINAGSVKRSYKTIIGGNIIYYFSVNKNGIIDYIKTYSNKFRTSEDITV